MAVSRSVDGLARDRRVAPLPGGDRTCRSTVTDSESERNARDRMKTLTRSRSFGLAGGEYQFVTIEPGHRVFRADAGEIEVSSAACHRTGLTVLPVCGPGLRSDFALGEPEHRPYRPSVPFGSIDATFVVCRGGSASRPAAGIAGRRARGSEPHRRSGIFHRQLEAAAGERQREACGEREQWP